MPTTEEQIPELQARIAKLKRQQSHLSGSNPIISGMIHFPQLTMPASAVAAMTDAVPDSLMRDICADDRRQMLLHNLRRKSQNRKAQVGVPHSPLSHPLVRRS